MPVADPAKSKEASKKPTVAAAVKPKVTLVEPKKGEFDDDEDDSNDDEDDSDEELDDDVKSSKPPFLLLISQILT